MKERPSLKKQLYLDKTSMIVLRHNRACELNEGKTEKDKGFKIDFSR
jgi:hypothetical protein